MSYLNATRWSRYAVGVAFILIGFLCMRNPGTTLLSVAIYIGFALVLHGGMGVYMYFQTGGTSGHRTWLLVESILSLLTGTMFLMNLGAGSMAATTMMLLWVMVAGVFRVVTGFQMRSAGLGGWRVSLLSGAVLVVCAFVLAFHPVLAIFTLTTLVAWTFVFYGVVLILEGTVL